MVTRRRSLEAPSRYAFAVYTSSSIAGLLPSRHFPSSMSEAEVVTERVSTEGAAGESVAESVEGDVVFFRRQIFFE